MEFSHDTPPMETVYYGSHNRFMIKPFMSRFNTPVYFVHDAHMVSDADVQAGKHSPAIGLFTTRIDAVIFCKKVMKGSIEPEALYGD
jgi:hypothetical protein